MPMDKDQLSYALAKQVPAMERGFFIATPYGDIDIPAGKVADAIRAQVQRTLARDLAQQEARAHRA